MEIRQRISGILFYVFLFAIQYFMLKKLLHIENANG